MSHEGYQGTRPAAACRACPVVIVFPVVDVWGWIESTNRYYMTNATLRSGNYPIFQELEADFAVEMNLERR